MLEFLATALPGNDDALDQLKEVALEACGIRLLESLGVDILTVRDMGESLLGHVAVLSVDDFLVVFSEKPTQSRLFDAFSQFAPFGHVVVVSQRSLPKLVFQALRRLCLRFLVFSCLFPLVGVLILERLYDLGLSREVRHFPGELAGVRPHHLAVKVLLEAAFCSSIVEIVLFRIFEGLVGLELLLDHSLEHSVVRELLLKLFELPSQLPFVLWQRVVWSILQLELAVLVGLAEDLLLDLCLMFLR